MGNNGSFELRLFGGLEIRRNNETVALPQSKKTRALLAYLAITGRPHRRERLCTMFWDVPDDPRGALRWSLSKLRPLVDDPDKIRLLADRENVELKIDDADVDLRIARSLLDSGLEAVSTPDLKIAADNIKGEFLPGLDLPNLHQYQAWLTAERIEALDLQMTVFAAISDRLAEHPKEALAYARLAAELDPEGEQARALFLKLQPAKTLGGRHPVIEIKPAPTLLVEAGVASDRPAIAVLPFNNMSGDPKDEFISDGVTEDLITELSRFRSLCVIARNSSFTYKNRPTPAQDVGRDLGVQYIVEGGVRRIERRVRATAQLVETDSGVQCWAERYDRDFDDIFALQEEIARTIAAAIEPELGTTERERSRRKPIANLSAWDWYQRGVWHTYRDTKADDAKAIRNFEHAIALSPDFAPPYAAKAFTLFQNILNGHNEPGEAAIAEARAFAEKAVTLDDKDAFSHMALGRISLLQRRHNESVAELETAITLNPSFADAYHALGFTLIFSGQPEKAVRYFDAAIRLSPHDPRLSSFYELKAEALFFEDRLEEALETARLSARRPNASHWAYATLAAILGHVDRIAEAKRAWNETQKRKPEFSGEFVRRVVYYSKNPAYLDKFIAGLRKAGAPE